MINEDIFFPISVTIHKQDRCREFSFSGPKQPTVTVLSHNQGVLSTMSFADSLWEFVLDDYEDQKSLASRFTRKKKKKKQNKSSKSRGFLGGSKREARSEYRDEEEDGIWDIITGNPPKATELRRSRSFSGISMANSARNSRTRSASLTRSQSNLSEQDTISSDKKKNRFTKRFSRNKNQKYSDDSSMRDYAGKRISVKETALVDSRDDRPPSDDDDDEEEFDPVELLLTKIADTLDPWGIDSDGSYSDDGDSLEGSDEDGDRSSFAGSESYASVQQHSRSKNARNKTSKSLLRSPKPERFDSSRYPYQKRGKSPSTEIRIRVDPVGTTLSEEVVEIKEQSDEDESRDIPSDEEKQPLFSASFDTDDSPESESNEPKIRNFNEKREINGNVGRNQVNEEKRTPAIARTPEVAQPVNRNENNKEPLNAKASKGLKKVMCGAKRVGKFNSTKPDTKEAFPSSRMVIDGESHLVPESDPLCGVIGPMTGSKGPQPVFAYDYESNMNMDVSYTNANQSPRNSMIVRKLGTPPPILTVPGEETVVLQVEASLVSETDCIVRQGLWWGQERPSYPNTPGIDVVGKIYCTRETTEKTYGLKPMDTVMSLIKWGGNTRFLTIHPRQLVKVPEGLDPADVACLPECYLSAFQVLHMGQPGNNRYRQNALKGKSILILGCMTNNMGKALIELARHAGVANIYATAKKKHWKTLVSYGVMPLSTDPMQYMERIAGTMDLVLAPNGNLREDVCPVHFRALVPKDGQLIIGGHRIVGNDIPLEDWKESHQRTTIACGKNKALQKILHNSMTYDVYEEWEKNLDLCKRDLVHLLKLLESKAIKPEVLDRIPLNKVGKAHELLETKRLPGFLVCEPWIKSKKRALYL